MDKDTSKFDEDFIKKYNEESNEGYCLQVDDQYLEKLHELHDDLPFLPERMKIEKVKKIGTNSHDQIEYVIQIRNIKQPLSHRLALKMFLRVIKFYQNVWLKQQIDINTDLRKTARK